MKSYIKSGLAIALAALAVPTSVFGHVISIGYVNSGPSSVTIWLGTYTQPPSALEGSLNLVGVSGNPFPSTTVAFNLLTTPDGVAQKPVGLVDGVNNFWVQYGGRPNSLPLVNDDSSWLAQFPNLPADHWQGVTFSGLTPGSYQFTYVPIANPSAQWTPWSTELNGVFDLSGVVQPPSPTGVPDAGSSLALLSMGLGVISLIRRRMTS